MFNGKNYTDDVHGSQEVSSTILTLLTRHLLLKSMKIAFNIPLHLNSNLLIHIIQSVAFSWEETSTLTNDNFYFMQIASVNQIYFQQSILDKGSSEPKVLTQKREAYAGLIACRAR